MPSYVQADRPLAVSTPLGKDVLLLIGLSGREALSELFRFELDLLAEVSASVPFDKLLGQKIVCEIRLPHGASRYVAGIASRVSQGPRDSTFTSYRMEVVPQFWLLTRRAQCRIFQHKSVPDILKQVLDGLEVSYEIQGTFEPRDFCCQYRETDFAFASRLMEEEGIYYFFRHTSSGHKLVLANTPQSHPDAAPAQAVYHELTGEPAPPNSVMEWNRTQEIRSGKIVLWDHCFELPHKHLAAEKSTVETVQAGAVGHKLKVANNDKLEIYDYPGAYAQRFDGVDRGGGDASANVSRIFDDNKRTVEIRMQEEAAHGVVVRGAGNCPQFAAGHRFSLERHFNADGQYVLTAVEHSARLDDYRTSSEQDAFIYENVFTCIPGAVPYRPPRVTPLPRIAGAQTAVVVGPSGEEIFVDKYGRIKVQFHWDRQGANDGDSSCWLRVATPWAGKQWGMIHIPRIGQEVVVAFEEGDVDRPIVVGSVYNADQMPPYSLPSNKTQSGVRSRSSLQGAAANCNEIRFEDKKGSEHVLIHAEKDQAVEVENDEVVAIGHDRTEEVGNDEKITIKHDRTEEVKHDEKITIGNNRTENVGNDETITISNNRKVTIERGNDSLRISLGKQETEALQSIELKVGQSSIKIDQMQIVLKAMMVKIDASMAFEVKGGLSGTVDGGLMTTVKGAVVMIN